MFHRMLTSALFAGFAAGLLAALLHFAFIQKYVLLGETYENGKAVHYAGVDAAAAMRTDDHGSGVADGHDHDHGAATAPVQPGEGALGRNALTVLFTALVYAGYGMIMVAGFAVAEHFGHEVRARDGLFWGLAGFVTVQLLPAIGLAPELPGTLAPDVGLRQAWWLGTAAATATALALIAYGRVRLVHGAAILLLVSPHLIGAPALDGFIGVAPPELAATFAARALAVGLIGWATLGFLAGRFWSGQGI